MAEDKQITVTVVVRARPFLPGETDEGSSSCLEFKQADNQICINGRPFCFDHVFDHEADQETVYEMCAAPLIDHFFRGFNCTIFAYGQTGSGKTFTMGTESSFDASDDVNKGIAPRIIEAIFNRIKNSGDDSVVVKCSMLEIYEERVIDLLSEMRDKPELFIREHPEEGIFVENLRRFDVQDFPETLRRLQQGCLVRTKGRTAMNAKSSRSHAIFTLYMKHSLDADLHGEAFMFLHFIKNSGKFLRGTFCQAEFNLVDLAGSERLKKSQAMGERKKEGIKTNEGLLALGKVISALTDATRRRSHVPYRDSRLTRLLQDSLGGNTRSLMIACISPANSDYYESFNTLCYAESAKNIKNLLKVNRVKRQVLSESAPNLAHEKKTDIEEMKKLLENFMAQNMRMSEELAAIITDHAVVVEKAASIERQRDELIEKLVELQQEIDQQASFLQTYANDPLITHQNLMEMCVKNYHLLKRKLIEILTVRALANEDLSRQRCMSELEAMRQETVLSSGEIGEFRQRITSADTNQVEGRQWTLMSSILMATSTLQQMFTAAVKLMRGDSSLSEEILNLKKENVSLKNLVEQRDSELRGLNEFIAEKDKELLTVKENLQKKMASEAAKNVNLSGVSPKLQKRKSGNLDKEEENMQTDSKRCRSTRVTAKPERFGCQTAISSTARRSNQPSLIGQLKSKISNMSASACACKRGNCLGICGCSRKGKKCSSRCGCSRQLCCNRSDVPEVTSPRETDEFENKSQEDNPPKKTIATRTFAVPLLGQGLLRNFSPKPRTGGSLFTPLTPSARKYFGGGV